MNACELSALRYAEKHGIIEYHLEGRNMVYYTSWPMERVTYRAVVNLDKMRETRTPMKRYTKPYSGRIGGRYQANYLV